MKKRTNLDIAKRHLELASKQCDKASVHSWEPSDPAECVTLVFYAYENAIVAAAEASGQKWKKTHSSKAEVSGDLAKQKKLKTRSYFKTLRKTIMKQAI